MKAPQNGREQGERGKMLKGAGSIDPPNRASILPSKILHRAKNSQKLYRGVNLKWAIPFL